VVRYEDGEEDELPESEVRPLAPTSDLLTTLREGRVGDAKGFELRRQALRLDDERRNDALGALLASRVLVKPHQVGVVQRVLSARRPRFVLADEVGLGKTIEAGMIFSALRLAGLAKRVLVVAPSHLTVQWLAELFHKFNQLFTLMDRDRHASSLQEQPDVSPWIRFPHVVTSLELLVRSPEQLREACSPEAAWDLVVMDEAHHLKGEGAFAAAQALARNTWGLLLLTATPLQLDPDEYRGLLTLMDAESAPSRENFERRRAQQEELSETLRALLERRDAGAALRGLAERFPEDEVLRSQVSGDVLLAHLAETYSLSDHLVRNRRAIVGGFSERRLHRHRVELPQAERAARTAAREALREVGGLAGAPLATLLRRLDSSPAAFYAALSGARALAGLRDQLTLPSRDAKLAAFETLLRSIWEDEPKAKVLVFTEARETLEDLQQELRKASIEALVYHGDLALVERDRQVARFRDPDGPRVLLCTEVGGEGRNFQFAHHLVHYDLPWSPSVVEQRIGRLDRIGQQHPVEIHVFDLPGTFAADVLRLLDEAVGVFGETVGGLDAVLEEVEPRLAELALTSPQERDAYTQTLTQRVQEARAQVRRAYDPLLDLRSADRPGVEALVTRAAERIGLEEAEGSSVEEALWSIARDLDERLEETVTELARKVGIGVDTDEQVEAFQCAFHFGHALNVEALPGLDIHQDRTVLGTFWRDTAVEQEEVEYFATGHPIVESLFGFLRDGPFGRSGMRFIEKRGAPKARGVECLFHLVPPEPADTTPGARVPSRQLARFVNRWLVPTAVVVGAEGQPRAESSLLPVLEAEGRALKGDEALRAFLGFGGFIEGAVAEATRAAEAELERVRQGARAAIELEQALVLSRLTRALTHQRIPPAQRDARLDQERAHYAALLRTLDGIKVSLDSVCGFVINR
jgi:ATP-dependent helicase HepA